MRNSMMPRSKCSEQIEHHLHEEEKRSDGIFPQGLEEGMTLTQVVSPAASNSAKRSASFCVRNTPPISPSLSLATQYPRPFSLTSKWCKVSTAAGAKLDIFGLPICFPVALLSG